MSRARIVPPAEPTARTGSLASGDLVAVVLPGPGLRGGTSPLGPVPKEGSDSPGRADKIRRPISGARRIESGVGGETNGRTGPGPIFNRADHEHGEPGDRTPRSKSVEVAPSGSVPRPARRPPLAR